MSFEDDWVSRYARIMADSMFARRDAELNHMLHWQVKAGCPICKEELELLHEWELQLMEHFGGPAWTPSSS